MNNHRELVIALSGLWQAANMVDDIANTSDLNSQQHKRLTCLLDSVLIIEAQTATEVYEPIKQLEFSMLGLLGFLKREHQGKPNVLVYMIQLMGLQKLMSKNVEMSNYIGSEIRRLSQQRSFYRDQQPVLMENLSRIYSETFGSLPMRQRIKVRGAPEILGNVQVQNSVRATLLTGVRAAKLWQQMGGNKFQLFFRRKMLEQNLSKLLIY